MYKSLRIGTLSKVNINCSNAGHLGIFLISITFVPIAQFRHKLFMMQNFSDQCVEDGDAMSAESCDTMLHKCS